MYFNCGERYVHCRFTVRSEKINLVEGQRHQFVHRELLAKIFIYLYGMVLLGLHFLYIGFVSAPPS